MSVYASRAEVAAKIDWEGIDYLVFEYGLDPEDMPDDELKAAAADMKAAASYYEDARNRFMALLPDAGDS